MQLQQYFKITSYISVTVFAVTIGTQAFGAENLMDFSLQELLSLKVSGSGSLTVVPIRRTPAALNRITDNDIQDSGARDLLELLDIYVPGAQWVRHHFEVKHLGVRGIISDREDKVMIRVNGRVMNERMHIGAMTERDFPMLDDIAYIDVIRGAGSAVYGLGAVSMVIDIHTRNARNYQGASVNARYGFGQRFGSLSVQKTFSFNENSGLYVYGGVGDVKGANSKDAPIVYGHEMQTVFGEHIALGDPLPHKEVRDGSQYRSLMPLKFHVQLSYGDMDLWARYTRGGENFAAPYRIWQPPGNHLGLEGLNTSGKIEAWGSGYEQLTLAHDYKMTLPNNITVNTLLSFDRTSWERRLFINTPRDENHAEYEYLGRLSFTYPVNDSHDIVAGGALSHERFGYGSRGQKISNARLGEDANRKWSTNTWSLFGEWQWRLDDAWTSFLGGRIDKNTYSHAIYSPRAALVFTPTLQHTTKLMLTQSSRMSFAEENRAAKLRGSQFNEPERLRSAELRHEYSLGNFFGALGAFYIDLNAIGWNELRDNGRGGAEVVSTQKQYGIELELRKIWRNTQVTLNHTYTKLLSHKLRHGVEFSFISAAGSGEGNDLNNWSNHQTKLMVTHDIGLKARLFGNIRIYWGLPGKTDQARFIARQTQPFAPSAFASDPRFTKPQADIQAFLNLGAQYTFDNGSIISFTAHNVLGLFEKDLNKRVYYSSPGSYRSEAESISLTWTTPFPPD